MKTRSSISYLRSTAKRSANSKRSSLRKPKSLARKKVVKFDLNERNKFLNDIHQGKNKQMKRLSKLKKAQDEQKKVRKEKIQNRKERRDNAVNSFTMKLRSRSRSDNEIDDGIIYLMKSKGTKERSINKNEINKWNDPCTVSVKPIPIRTIREKVLLRKSAPFHYRWKVLKNLILFRKENEKENGQAINGNVSSINDNVHEKMGANKEVIEFDRETEVQVEVKITVKDDKPQEAYMELYAPELNSDIMLSISRPAIEAATADFYNAKEIKFSRVLMETHDEENHPFKFNRAMIFFPPIHPKSSDKEITVTFWVTTQDLSLLSTNNYWLTAGVEYEERKKIWIGQTLFKKKDTLTPARTGTPSASIPNVASSVTLVKGETVVTNFDVNLQAVLAAAEKLIIGVSIRDEVATCIKYLDRISLKSVGSNYYNNFGTFSNELYGRMVRNGDEEFWIDFGKLESWPSAISTDRLIKFNLHIYVDKNCANTSPGNIDITLKYGTSSPSTNSIPFTITAMSSATTNTDIEARIEIPEAVKLDETYASYYEESGGQFLVTLRDFGEAFNSDLTLHLFAPLNLTQEVLSICDVTILERGVRAPFIVSNEVLGSSSYRYYNIEYFNKLNETIDRLNSDEDVASVSWNLGRWKSLGASNFYSFNNNDYIKILITVKIFPDIRNYIVDPEKKIWLSAALQYSSNHLWIGQQAFVVNTAQQPDVTKKFEEENTDINIGEGHIKTVYYELWTDVGYGKPADITIYASCHGGTEKCTEANPQILQIIDVYISHRGNNVKCTNPHPPIEYVNYGFNGGIAFATKTKVDLEYLCDSGIRTTALDEFGISLVQIAIDVRVVNDVGTVGTNYPLNVIYNDFTADIINMKVISLSTPSITWMATDWAEVPQLNNRVADKMIQTTGIRIHVKKTGETEECYRFRIKIVVTSGTVCSIKFVRLGKYIKAGYIEKEEDVVTNDDDETREISYITNKMCNHGDDKFDSLLSSLEKKKNSTIDLIILSRSTTSLSVSVAASHDSMIYDELGQKTISTAAAGDVNLIAMPDITVDWMLDSVDEIDDTIHKGQAKGLLISLNYSLIDHTRPTEIPEHIISQISIEVEKEKVEKLYLTDFMLYNKNPSIGCLVNPTETITGSKIKYEYGEFCLSDRRTTPLSESAEDPSIVKFMLVVFLHQDHTFSPGEIDYPVTIDIGSGNTETFPVKLTYEELDYYNGTNLLTDSRTVIYCYENVTAPTMKVKSEGHMEAMITIPPFTNVPIFFSAIGLYKGQIDFEITEVSILAIGRNYGSIKDLIITEPLYSAYQNTSYNDTGEIDLNVLGNVGLYYESDDYDATYDDAIIFNISFLITDPEETTPYLSIGVDTVSQIIICRKPFDLDSSDVFNSLSVTEYLKNHLDIYPTHEAFSVFFEIEQFDNSTKEVVDSMLLVYLPPFLEFNRIENETHSNLNTSSFEVATETPNLKITTGDILFHDSISFTVVFDINETNYQKIINYTLTQTDIQIPYQIIGRRRRDMAEVYGANTIKTFEYTPHRESYLLKSILDDLSPCHVVDEANNEVEIMTTGWIFPTAEYEKHFLYFKFGKPSKINAINITSNIIVQAFHLAWSLDLVQWVHLPTLGANTLQEEVYLEKPTIGPFFKLIIDSLGTPISQSTNIKIQLFGDANLAGDACSNVPPLYLTTTHVNYKTRSAIMVTDTDGETTLIMCAKNRYGIYGHCYLRESQFDSWMAIGGDVGAIVEYYEKTDVSELGLYKEQFVLFGLSMDGNSIMASIDFGRSWRYTTESMLAKYREIHSEYSLYFTNKIVASTIDSNEQSHLFTVNEEGITIDGSLAASWD
ncbi:hypothetical protein SNEBB_003293 [Seison nebaliae]|nr:hypothetical protein SNEBB_003293 [Seison nebaliae]